MPQNRTGADVVKDITDAPKNAYHALTSAFGLDDEGDDPKKKKPVTPPGPTMVDEANKTFADDPSTRTPAKPSFMAKAMKKPAPAAPSPMSAARNRYGSTQKR